MKIIAIIGARLNSNRLPGKHLLDLAGQPLISRLVTRLKQSRLLNDVVLATTADDYNRPLVNWARKANVSLLAFKGHVNDLMGRLDHVVKREQPDYLVYICGDCPLVEPDFIDHALIELIANKDNETVTFHEGVQSIHEGIDIYSFKGWKKLLSISATEMAREHVGYADKLVPTLRRLEISDSDDFSAIEHRISVDTPADYQFMREVYHRWYAENPENSIVSLKWVQQQLIEDDKLRQINAHVMQKQPETRYQKVSLYCHVSKQIGMGHLKRCSKVADSLQERLALGTDIHIVGEHTPLPWLKTHVHWYNSVAHMFETMLNDNNPLWMLDFNPEYIDITLLKNICEKTKVDKCTKLIAIDKLDCLLDVVDKLFIPSFCNTIVHPKVSIGWQNYLFEPIRDAEKKQQVLVLTGGSDALGYGLELPQLL